MRTILLLASAALVLSGCTDEDGSAPDPDPTPAAISQAEARASVPVDGVDGTAITWVDTTATPGDPVDVVKYLTAIEVVGQTYSDPIIERKTLEAFSDAPPGDLVDTIDPDGADAERYGPVVGPVRAFAVKLFASGDDVTERYPGVNGEYVVVGQCIDRRAQTLPDSPGKAMPGTKNWMLIQKADDAVDGPTVWKVQRNTTLYPPAPDAAYQAFEDKCDAFRL